MCEIGSIYVWIYASFICAISLPPITFALKMFRLFNTNIQSINYFYIGCKSAWDCHSCNWSPDSANFSHHDLTHPQPHYYFAFIFFNPFYVWNIFQKVVIYFKCSPTLRPSFVCDLRWPWPQRSINLKYKSAKLWYTGFLVLGAPTDWRRFHRIDTVFRQLPSTRQLS